VFEHLDTAVIIIDQSLLIEDLNPAAESLLGISQDRARGESLLQLLGDNREIQDVFMRTLESGVTYANELRLGRTEVHEAERVIDCRVSLLREPENALIIQHGAGRQMVRQLAHEIKNPLGGLRGAAQLLDRQLDSDELKEYTNVIISEADRLASLVDTLLGPGGPPNKQALNVHELLEYVVRLTEAEQEKIMIRRDYDPGLPLFLLDRDQMVQAFLNLLQNASTALDGRGEITLRTRAIMNFTIGDIRHPAVASIEIEDDGPGIPPELQDSIFYPLVTTRPEGTGLGLPAAQELISRHGGLIEFESRPGRTVFFVRIPLSDSEATRVG
jgi:two-component system nitrogen regulation sensor histidine kinase GlnL